MLTIYWHVICFHINSREGHVLKDLSSRLTVPGNGEGGKTMSQFLQNQTLSKKLLFVFSIILLFLTVSGLFSHLNSSNPRMTMEDIYSKRFKVYQAGAMVIKNVASVQSNLDKITQWVHAGFDKREIDLLGKEQLAVLEGVNETIRKTLDAEWLTPEEKELYKAIQRNFADYREFCSSTIRMATLDLQMASPLIATAGDSFKKINRNLHDLLDLETRLCPENSNIPNRSFSAALGNLYPAAGGCHRSGLAEQPMSRQAHYRSCL
jgi:hypothetical protein